MFTENDIKCNRRLLKRKNKISLSALAKIASTAALALVAVITVFTMQLTTAFGTIDVEAKTISNSVTYQLSDKKCYVGLNVGGAHPETSNWSSSDLKIATVSTKGDNDGGHKVTFKKKGKVTISCKIKTSKGNWKKGDIHKWTLIIK